jgi:hypothetical protein
VRGRTEIADPEGTGQRGGMQQETGGARKGHGIGKDRRCGGGWRRNRYHIRRPRVQRPRLSCAYLQ